MSFDIAPDTLTITTGDSGAHRSVVALVVRETADIVMRVHTVDRPDGIDLVNLAHQPGHHPDHLYGAAYAETGAAMPDHPFPIIPFTRIVGIHIY